MKAFLKTYWKTLLFFTVVGLVGGFFMGIYLLDSYPPEIQQQILDQGITNAMLGLVTAVQSAGYGLVLGALGCGAFCTPPAQMARLFHQVLDEEEFRGRFSKIVFAIIDSPSSNNFKPFLKEFSK